MTNPDAAIGFKKVGHKARRGRRRYSGAKAHTDHRKPGTPRDPILRAFLRDRRRRRRELREREPA